jgi:hypothetical protein
MPRLEDFVKSLPGAKPGLGWVIRVQGSGQEYVHRSFVHDRMLSALTGEIRIDFTWEFDTTPELNIGTVLLYNLDNSRIEEFKKGGSIQLKCGWQGVTEETRLVIHGTIEAVEDFTEGEMRAFKIIFTDAPEHIHTKIGARTWKPNVSYSRVFLDDAKDLGLPIKLFNPARDGLYRTGMNCFRNIWQHMRMVARDMRSKLYVYNRQIVLAKPDDTVGDEVVWSQITGLQKIQRAIRGTQDATAKVGYAGYEPVAYRIRNLFTPEVGPDTPLRVIDVSPDPFRLMAEGRFRVTRGIHFCDGDAYITEVDVVPIDEQSAKFAEEKEQQARRTFQANREAVLTP